MCVCKKRGEMCRKTSKRQPLACKKKRKSRGAATLEKNENILLINIQEKDEELRDFEDDERAREQRLRGNKRAE